MIIDFFKIGVYEVDLNLDVKAISEYCTSYSKKNKGRDISNIGGYHSKPLQGEHLI